jgi:hypothetical protein
MRARYLSQTGGAMQPRSSAPAVGVVRLELAPENRLGLRGCPSTRDVTLVGLD